MTEETDLDAKFSRVRFNMCRVLPDCEDKLFQCQVLLEDKPLKKSMFYVFIFYIYTFLLYIYNIFLEESQPLKKTLFNI